MSMPPEQPHILVTASDSVWTLIEQKLDHRNWIAPAALSCNIPYHTAKLIPASQYEEVENILEAIRKEDAEIVSGADAYVRSLKR